MTNQEKLQKLKEYVDICKELEELKMFYREKCYSISAMQLSDMPRGCGNGQDLVGSKLVRVESIDNMVDNRLKKLEAIRQEIEKAIDGLEESCSRRLMHMRYIQGISWEAICVNMRYSWRQIHRLHSICLQKIEI